MAASAANLRRRRVQAAGHQPAQKSDSSTVIDHRRKPHNNNRLKKRKRFSLRDQFIRTNVDIYLLIAFFAIVNGLKLHHQVVEATSVESDGGENITVKENIANTTDVKEVHWHAEVYAIFFPVFCQTIAIFIYYILSRYLSFIPYTAIVFLLGVGIGFKADIYQESDQNAILLSSLKWININGQVVLLVFLPGLIFLDSVTINVHLFFQAFWQLMIFAFPMVLAGAGLTGLVARYVFPFGWSWNLAMTFGAILSATDPVAVAGLFNALGAPPRMQMHISGESLLNDGSSVLLYNIFSQRFFYQLGVEDFGADIGWGEGFSMFFQLTLGGGLIGLAFGLGTVFMLKFLNRRLSAEENVTQVVLTLTVAYMAYFVAEILAECSGIISTIVCGLTVKVLGITLIHDVPLMLNFWAVLGDVLNTLLFVLGGTLWGNIISPRAGSFQIDSTFSDWGYLFALYVMLIIIRFILVFGFYPIISRIGIGSSWKEAIFMSFGGFRGTVGIALALSLSSQVWPNTNKVNCELSLELSLDECLEYRNQASQLFCFVGGISILTLLLNGLLSGPLLKLLKLAKSEKTREKVVESYWKRMVEKVLVDYVRLLSQERFKDVDFSLVREHVPFIGGISLAELMAAVDVHRRNTPPHLYSNPHLEHVIPYIFQAQQRRRHRSVVITNGYSLETFFGTKMDALTTPVTTETPSTIHSTDKSSKSSGQTTQQRRESQTKQFMRCNKDIFDPESFDETASEIHMDEERLNFIEILRRCYHEQIGNGEIDENGDLKYSLFEGLEFCEESAAKGQPLNDWNATKVASATNVVICNRFFIIALIQIKLFLSQWKQAVKEMWTCKKKCRCGACDKNSLKQRLSANYELFLLSKVSFLVRQSLAFQNAHRLAQKEFVEEFASYPLTPAEETVIEESKAQVLLAEQDLDEIDTDDVNLIKGHLICRILLNKAVKYVETLSWQGLIPEKDANAMLELLDGYRERILLCQKLFHEGKLDLRQQSNFLRRLPPHRIEELKLASIIETMSKSGVETVEEDARISNLVDTTNLEAGDLITSLPEDSDKNSLFSSLRSREFMTCSR